jgi:CheY-like chemotaxis protein
MSAKLCSRAVKICPRSEVGFWRNWLNTKGARFPGSYDRAFNADLPLQTRIADLLRVQPHWRHAHSIALWRIAAVYLDIGIEAIHFGHLDIEKNGVDLCLKIRQTELNRNTPIVFITCQSDFSVRSRSSVVGGQDLIAKPFLTFEVALKALTLVIQNRLRNEPVSKPEVSEAPTEELAAVS